MFPPRKKNDAAIPPPVKAGRLFSGIVLVAYPFLLLAGVMSLGSSRGGLLSACTESWFGAFLCTSVFYPLLFLAAFLASRAALGRGRVLVAAAFAWLPLLALVLTAWPAGVFDQLL